VPLKFPKTRNIVPTGWLVLSLFCGAALGALLMLVWEQGWQSAALWWRSPTQAVAHDAARRGAIVGMVTVASVWAGFLTLRSANPSDR
jgi:lysylphosphatidylglycerol synthetase-like protein (DUF2156 family)